MHRLQGFGTKAGVLRAVQVAAAKGALSPCRTKFRPRLQDALQSSVARGRSRLPGSVAPERGGREVRARHLRPEALQAMHQLPPSWLASQSLTTGTERNCNVKNAIASRQARSAAACSDFDDEPWFCLCDLP